MKDLRKYEKEVGVHQGFTFVSRKSEQRFANNIPMEVEMTEIDKIKKEMSDMIQARPTTAMLSPAYSRLLHELYTLGFRPQAE